MELHFPKVHCKLCLPKPVTWLVSVVIIITVVFVYFCTTRTCLSTQTIYTKWHQVPAGGTVAAYRRNSSLTLALMSRSRNLANFHVCPCVSLISLTISASDGHPTPPAAAIFPPVAICALNVLESACVSFVGQRGGLC